MTINNTDKSQQELITLTFRHINSFKRHRALEQIRREEKEYDKANFHALKQYQLFDQIELGLRAIQKGQRSIDSEE